MVPSASDRAHLSRPTAQSRSTVDANPGLVFPAGRGDQPFFLALARSQNRCRYFAPSA